MKWHSIISCHILLVYHSRIRSSCTGLHAGPADIHKKQFILPGEKESKIDVTCLSYIAERSELIIADNRNKAVRSLQIYGSEATRCKLYTDAHQRALICRMCVTCLRRTFCSSEREDSWWHCSVKQTTGAYRTELKRSGNQI